MAPGAGYFAGQVNVDDSMKRLTEYIDSVPQLFKEKSFEELTSKPLPGKWSNQQVLGHLVDSAINNLKRFTEIQFLPQPYSIISYQQDELVKVNYYQEMPVDQLIDLWKTLNRQIIWIVEHIPSAKIEYAVDPKYDDHEMKTLGWVICDYVTHMEHHLKQVTGTEKSVTNTKRS